MEREIFDINLHWDETYGLLKLSARIDGGQTGSHFVEYNRKELDCDCFGFGRHKHCRHTEAINLMKDALEQTRSRVYYELNK